MAGSDPWIVCPDCEGEGKHALHGISITGAEWAEWHEDEQEAYIRGDYDTPCNTCEGRTTIRKSKKREYEEDLNDRYTRMRESGIYDYR